MAIIISKQGQSAQRVEESGVADEAQLQAYIAANPESLPLDDLKSDPPQLLVIGREFPTQSGSIDVLAVDNEGDLYIIETKLYKNPDKRLVVAQILDYGAALWKQYGDAAQFIRAADSAARAHGGRDLRQALRAAFRLENDTQVEALVDALGRNLAAGSIKFIVLMNQLHSQLRNLILFLNEMSQFDLYAVEMEFYRHDGLEIVIPKLFGAEAKKEMNRGSGTRRRWDEESFLNEARKLPTETFQAIEKVLSESKKLTDDLSYGTGTVTGSFSPKFAHASPRSFFSVYSDGRLTLNLAWHAGHLEACKYTHRFVEALNKVSFCRIPKHDAYRPDQAYAPELYVTVAADVWVPKVEQFVKIIRDVFAKPAQS